MSVWNKVLLALFLVILLFVALNFDYLKKNLNYLLHKHPRPNEQKNSQQAKIITPNTLIISSLDISVPVQYVDQKSEAAFQTALQNGVVHYPGTALPGQTGNVYIFGHSSDFIFSKGHYKTVFALLPNIQNGAAIILSDNQGTAYEYIVQKSFVTAANDISVINPPSNGKKLLTLQTSYPVGTALRRYIAVAELINR